MSVCILVVRQSIITRISIYKRYSFPSLATSTRHCTQIVYTQGRYIHTCACRQTLFNGLLTMSVCKFMYIYIHILERNRGLCVIEE